MTIFSYLHNFLHHLLGLLSKKDLPLHLLFYSMIVLLKVLFL